MKTIYRIPLITALGLLISLDLLMANPKAGLRGLFEKEINSAASQRKALQPFISRANKNEKEAAKYFKSQGLSKAEELAKQTVRRFDDGSHIIYDPKTSKVTSVRAPWDIPARIDTREYQFPHTQTGVALSDILFNIQRGLSGTENPILLYRSYKHPNGKMTEIEHTMAGIKVKEKDYHGVVEASSTNTDGLKTTVSMLSPKTVQGFKYQQYLPHDRKIDLELSGPVSLDIPRSPNRHPYQYQRTKSFTLPNDIQGSLVSININGQGDRLTFITTEGFEYTYSIQRKGNPIDDFYGYPQKDGDFTVEFRRIGSKKLPGGVESLQANVTTPWREQAKGNARGMKVEDHGRAQ